MSFNYLIVQTEAGPLSIQFKWGWEEHIEYYFGSKIDWLGSPRPEDADGRVEVLGVSDESSEYDNNGLSNLYKVILINDVIIGVEKLSKNGDSDCELKLR